MVINNVTDAFENFKFSWATTGVLSFAAINPIVEGLFPVITQVILLASVQLISVGVDYMRRKLKLKKRTEKIDVESVEK